jgi:16S rRNA (uracil1498-N3)-methyltransferase
VQAETQAVDGNGHRLLLLVGPEGDWTVQEVQALQAAGALPVGLGPQRLRVETAALALLSAAMLHQDSTAA